MSTRPRTPRRTRPRPGKLPITELVGMKERRQPIVMVTAYDAPSGRLADEAGADIVLVGDSAAMTVLGHDSTVPATMDEMIVLTRAVTRGAHRPLVVADMPFGSFQVSDVDAVENAIRFVKEAGADAVKLEGAGADARARRHDRGRRHPGHGPHRPDTAVRDGARWLQGAGPHRRSGTAPARRRARARGGRLLRARARGDARAGRGSASASVLTIPTIGIGAGAGTDGQVLVWHDLLGLYSGTHRGSSSATPTWHRHPRGTPGVSPPTSASGAFRRTSTPTRCRGRARRIRGRRRRRVGCRFE